MNTIAEVNVDMALAQPPWTPATARPADLQRTGAEENMVLEREIKCLV